MNSGLGVFAGKGRVRGNDGASDKQQASRRGQSSSIAVETAPPARRLSWRLCQCGSCDRTLLTSNRGATNVARAIVGGGQGLYMSMSTVALDIFPFPFSCDKNPCQTAKRRHPARLCPNVRLSSGTRRNISSALASSLGSTMLALFLSTLLLSTLTNSIPVPARMPMPPNELARLAEQDAATLSAFLTETLPAGLHSTPTHPFSVAAHANSPVTAFIDAAGERQAPSDRGTSGRPGFTNPFEATRPQPRHYAQPQAFEPEGGPGTRAPPNTPERDQHGYTTVFGFPGLLPPQQRVEVPFVWPPVTPSTRRPRE